MKESLQKVTDLEKVKTLEDVKNFIELYPDRTSDVIKKLEGLMNETYVLKSGQESKIEELVTMCFELEGNNEMAEFIRNSTYETNHMIIARFINSHILQYESFPPIMTIKKETGLSRQTIYRHIKNGFNDKFNTAVKGKIEYLIPSALEKLYLIGIEDRNATALKNFIDLSGITINSSQPNVNNYIQINNLKITKEDFNQLPNEAIIEIEEIVSRSLNSKKETI